MNTQPIRYRYPAPIATAFWEAERLSKEGPEVYGKQKRLIHLFEIILKYTCAVMLSYYRQQMNQVEEVETALQNIRRPLMGHWRGLQRGLMKVYERADHVDALVKALTEAFTVRSQDPERLELYRRVCSLVPQGPSQGGHVSYGDVCERLVWYRNWITHKEGQYLKQPEIETQVPAIQALLYKMLLDLYCLAKYPLVYVKNMTRQADQNERLQMMLCMGSSHDWDSRTGLTQSALSTKHCYICRQTDDGQLQPFLDLHPFIVYTTCKEDHQEQVFAISEGGERGIEYISYECGHRFGHEESAELDFKDDLWTLLDGERWTQYRFDLALQQHGRYLKIILQGLQGRTTQDDYAEEYRRAEELLQDDPFEFPRPLIERIFAEYKIHLPTQARLSLEAFTAIPAAIEQGVRTMLEWRTRGAVRVVIEPEVGEVDATGRHEVSPTESTMYTLHAYDDTGKSITKTADVQVVVPETVEPPVIEWFTATLERIERGATAVLQWSTQRADRVTLDPAAGDVAAIGQCEVQPSDSTDYTLRAFNEAGVSQPETVRVEVFVPAPPSPPDGLLVQLWDVQLSEPIEWLIRSPQTNHSFAIGKNGALLFLGQDGQVRWQARAEAPLRAATFTADGRTLVTADWNGTLCSYDEYSDNPLWETRVPGVVSALETGRWGGQQGVFVGTWRQGIFFCNTRQGQLDTVAKTDDTISVLSAFSDREGCVVGNWEGGVMVYTAEGRHPHRVRLRQPVRALASFDPSNRILVLTTRHSFYALDGQGEVFWLYESPARVCAWAFGSNAGKCIYCTESGQHYEIRMVPVGEQYIVEGKTLRGLAREGHDALVADAKGDYLVARNDEGALRFYAAKTLFQKVAFSDPVNCFYLDPYGLTLLAAADNTVYAYRNQHKLQHARPSRLEIEFMAQGPFVLGKSTIVELRLTNKGERPATEVQGKLNGRFKYPISFTIDRILPGDVVTHRCDVVPEVAGGSVVSAELQHRDGDETKTMSRDNLITIEVGE
jgi:hypothetical protein